MSAGDDTTPPAKPYGGQPCPCMRGGFWPLTLRECLIHGDAAAAPPTETQRLRNQIDDLTRERDLYKRMLERYEPDPTYSTPTELDRLRAELAETRAAGDALADAAEDVIDGPTEAHLDDLGAAGEAWRSLRGDARTVPAADVRDPADEGDGLMSLLDEHWPVDIFRTDPMEDAADPGPRIVALLRWVDRLRAELAETRAELHGATGAAAVLRERGDALADATNALLDQWRWLNERSRPDGASTCETRLVEWRSVRGDAPTQPPADAADVRDPASETHRTSAAPTAAPDVRAWEDDGDWGWACSRCGYRSVAWWADRATARRAAHEHGRDRCPAAGGSSPASTDGDT